MKKIITLVALVMAAFSITALAAVATAQGASSDLTWELLAKDSERSSRWPTPSAYGEASWPDAFKVVAYTTRPGTLSWTIRCHDDDYRFSGSRSGQRNMRANRKTTVYLYDQVFVNGRIAASCSVSAHLDAGYSEKRATATVWVLAGHMLEGG